MASSPPRRSSRLAEKNQTDFREDSTPEPEPHPSVFNVFPLIQGLETQAFESLVNNMLTMLEFLPSELVACGGECNPNLLPQDTELEVEHSFGKQITSWQKLKSGFWQDEGELKRFKRYAQEIYEKANGKDYFEPGRPPPAFIIPQAEGHLMNPEPWEEYAEQLASRAFEEIGIGPFEFTATYNHLMFWEKGCIWTAPDRDSGSNHQVGTLLLVLKGQHNGGGISIHCADKCFFHPESPKLGSKGVQELGLVDSKPYWVAALRGGTAWDASSLAWGGPRIGFIYHLYFKKTTKNEKQEEVPVPYMNQLKEYINHAKVNTQPMYAENMLSSRSQAESRLEAQFQRWVEFVRDEPEKTQSSLVYVFDTDAYQGIIFGEQGQNKLMEVLRPRHRRVWNFLSKLPRAGKWADIVGRVLKQKYKLKVHFACLERMHWNDNERTIGNERDDEDEEADLSRWAFAINWTQGATPGSRMFEDEEYWIQGSAIMNLAHFQNRWPMEKKRLGIEMELEELDKDPKQQTPGRGQEKAKTQSKQTPKKQTPKKQTPKKQTPKKQTPARNKRTQSTSSRGRSTRSGRGGQKQKTQTRMQTQTQQKQPEQDTHQHQTPSRTAKKGQGQSPRINKTSGVEEEEEEEEEGEEQEQGGEEKEGEEKEGEEEEEQDSASGRKTAGGPEELGGGIIMRSTPRGRDFQARIDKGLRDYATKGK